MIQKRPSLIEGKPGIVDISYVPKRIAETDASVAKHPLGRDLATARRSVEAGKIDLRVWANINDRDLPKLMSLRLKANYSSMSHCIYNKLLLQSVRTNREVDFSYIPLFTIECRRHIASQNTPNNKAGAPRTKK